ncbi:MAG: class II aldolase/adducin family protein [Microbacterium sp.]|uniref:class II aldolase/adducin family protein n=1 Tax=Microbacterium sp. TaxID=51671 RepID=UPI003F9492A3
MAAQCDMGELRVETVDASRVLGQDPFLVLHGGGNTSVKNEEFIWAKASGFDLGSLVPEGLVQLRRADLDELLAQDTLSDTAMMDGYAAATVLPDQPAPTIEALFHHALPFTSVLHSHADAIVALTDTVRGLDLAAEVFGEDVVVVPYVMPGFELAKLAPELWRQSGGQARAMVLQNHGLFTMGDTVAQTLALHLNLVDRAEAYIATQGVDLRATFDASVEELDEDASPTAKSLCEDLRAHSTESHLVVLRCEDAEVRAFIERPDLERVTSLGPTTLEHVIRTKRVPLIGDDIAGYVRDYRAYFERNRVDGDGLRMLDPTPRVILHPELGLLAVGTSEKAAGAVMDIYRHTIRIIDAAERMGGYQTVSERQAFGLEYWELEQRRLAS